jgi:hypothetical protein
MFCTRRLHLLGFCFSTRARFLTPHYFYLQLPRVTSILKTAKKFYEKNEKGLKTQNGGPQAAAAPGPDNK